MLIKMSASDISQGHRLLDVPEVQGRSDLIKPHSFVLGALTTYNRKQ
jgi:hypothetical protein